MRTHCCPGCNTDFLPTEERPAFPVKVSRKRGRYHVAEEELLCLDCVDRLAESGTWQLPSGGILMSWPLRDDSANTSKCEGCGTVIVLPEDKRRRMVYCSNKCRQVIYRRRNAKANTVSCAQCGSEFTARRGAKYCSPKCRQAAYRARA